MKITVSRRPGVMPGRVAARAVAPSLIALLFGASCTGSIADTGPPEGEGVEIPFGPAPGGGGPTTAAGAPTTAGGGLAGGGGPALVGAPPPSGQPNAAPQPGVTPIRKLVASEYRNAIRDLLGAAAANAALPPPDGHLNGFSTIAASQFTLSGVDVEGYEKGARAAAAAVSIPTVTGCQPAGVDDAACMGQLVEGFGRRAWRRPVAADEKARWVAVGQTVARDAGRFDDGARAVIAGMLQSPSFLYLAPVGIPDPARPGGRRLSGFELAARLSFVIAGTTPTNALLEAAAKGELDSAAGVRTHAKALLGAGGHGLASFFHEHLGLAELSSVGKDEKQFPAWSPALANAMAEETRAFVHDIVLGRNADARELFDGSATFVNADLARVYKIAPPASGFARVPLPAASGRAGLLGQGSFLARLAHRETTSPTFRGLFVRERLLCQEMPSPPPNVDTTIKADPAGAPKTARQRLERHRSDPTCAGCHALMDPIGIGLETFDAIGAVRSAENGMPIDARSELDGRPFTGAAELGRLLREHPETMPCLLRNLFRFATGRLEGPAEETILAGLVRSFAENGYRLGDATVELVASDAFRFMKTAQGTP